MYALGADLAALDGASDDDAPAVAAADEPAAVRAVHAVLVAVGLFLEVVATPSRERQRLDPLPERLAVSGGDAVGLLRKCEEKASRFSAGRKSIRSSVPVV